MNPTIRSRQASFSTTSSVRAARVPEGVAPASNNDGNTTNQLSPPFSIRGQPSGETVYLTATQHSSSGNGSSVQHRNGTSQLSLHVPPFSIRDQPSGETVYLTAIQHSSSGNGSSGRRVNGIRIVSNVDASSIADSSVSQEGQGQSQRSSHHTSCHDVDNFTNQGHPSERPHALPQLKCHSTNTAPTALESQPSLGVSDTPSILAHRVLREEITTRYIQGYDPNSVSPSDSPFHHSNTPTNRRSRFSRFTESLSHSQNTPVDSNMKSRLATDRTLARNLMYPFKQLVSLITNPFLCRENLPLSSLIAQQEHFQMMFYSPHTATVEELYEPGQSVPEDQWRFSGLMASSIAQQATVESAYGPLALDYRQHDQDIEIESIPRQPIMRAQDKGYAAVPTVATGVQGSERMFPKQLYICRICREDFKKRPRNEEESKCWMMLCWKCRRDMGKEEVAKYLRMSIGTVAA